MTSFYAYVKGKCRGAFGAVSRAAKGRRVSAVFLATRSVGGPRRGVGAFVAGLGWLCVR